jgi:hypothetical protein
MGKVLPISLVSSWVSVLGMWEQKVRRVGPPLGRGLSVWVSQVRQQTLGLLSPLLPPLSLSIIQGKLRLGPAATVMTCHFSKRFCFPSVAFVGYICPLNKMTGAGSML